MDSIIAESEGFGSGVLLQVHETKAFFGGQFAELAGELGDAGGDALKFIGNSGVLASRRRADEDDAGDFLPAFCEKSTGAGHQGGGVEDDLGVAVSELDFAIVGAQRDEYFIDFTHLCVAFAQVAGEIFQRVVFQFIAPIEAYGIAAQGGVHEGATAAGFLQGVDPAFAGAVAVANDEQVLFRKGGRAAQEA